MPPFEVTVDDLPTFEPETSSGRTRPGHLPRPACPLCERSPWNRIVAALCRGTTCLFAVSVWNSICQE